MTTMTREQLTTLAAGESSAQLEKNTPAWHIARANEIFEWLDGRKDREREQDERRIAIERVRAANFRRVIAS